jgi:hypothetical protein
VAPAAQEASLQFFAMTAGLRSPAILELLHFRQNESIPSKAFVATLSLLLALTNGQRASAQNGAAALAGALTAAFHVPVSVSSAKGGRIQRVTVDTIPGPETAVRIAQFVRTHDDSVTTLDAIEIRFMHIDRIGAYQHTTVSWAGSFLPAMLPTDTAPGWAQAMLKPTPLPTIAQECPRRRDGNTDVGSLGDTTIDGRVLWRIIGPSTDRDLVAVDRTTLRPVNESRTDLAGNTVVVHYNGAHLALTLFGINGSTVLRRDTTFAVAPYSSGELDILLACMPLAKGYSARLPVFHAGDWSTASKHLALFIGHHVLHEVSRVSCCGKLPRQDSNL